MGNRLNGYVTVHRLDEAGGVTESVTFGPGDDLPAWARDAITNPDVWEEDGGSDPAAPSGVGGSAGGDSSELPPPQSGPAASIAAWTAYAERHGVTVAEGARRVDIIAALEAAGVRVDRED